MQTQRASVLAAIILATLTACSVPAERPLAPSAEAHDIGYEIEREPEPAKSQAEWADVLVKRIRRFWLRPPEAPASFQCVVRVALAPDGSVLASAVIKSCGTEAMDLSVRVAMLKASPFPLPAHPEDFVANLTVTFCPNENGCY